MISSVWFLTKIGFVYMLAYSYLDSCLNFRTPITQHNKTTCFASWRKTITQNLEWE